MKSRGKRARDSDADPVVLSTAPRKVAELCPPFVEDYAPYTKGQLNLTRSRQMTDCGAQWDAYYRNNTVNGYKDRHYLLREFRELQEALDCRAALVERGGASAAGRAPPPVVMLEVGCGVGNALLPIVEQYMDRVAPSDFQVYGFDISEVAVQLLQKKLDQGTRNSNTVAASPSAITTSPLGPLSAYVHCCAHDLTKVPLPVAVDGAWLPVQASFATIIFVLCSIKEADRHLFVDRMGRLLLEDGLVFVRDYAVGDHAQARFASRQVVEDDTFLRTNGTLSHFFSVDALTKLFDSCGFDTVVCQVVTRDVTNRREELTMSRKFVQGTFRKRKVSTQE